MKTEYYWIEGPWKGRLAIVPRPRGGDWLEDEIHSWHEAGLDTIVSLLTPDEIEEFDLGSEERLSKAQGIEFNCHARYSNSCKRLMAPLPGTTVKKT